MIFSTGCNTENCSDVRFLKFPKPSIKYLHTRKQIIFIYALILVGLPCKQSNYIFKSSSYFSTSSIDMYCFPKTTSLICNFMKAQYSHENSMSLQMPNLN